MYITNLGDQVTVEQIAEAVKAGRALLVNRYAGPPSLTLDGVEFDNRDHCYQMAESCWTSKPKTLGEALRAAYVWGY